MSSMIPGGHESDVATNHPSVETPAADNVHEVFIGTRVRKRVLVTFNGTVVDYKPEQKRYSVRYDNGLLEDLDESELKQVSPSLPQFDLRGL